MATRTRTKAKAAPPGGIGRAFFPDCKKWGRRARALGDRGVVDEGRLEALVGCLSLPFARLARLVANVPRRVPAKLIDPRRIEGLRAPTMAST